jgi:uncharacterized membrane protein YphA (DoxX/SURF4 family)
MAMGRFRRRALVPMLGLTALLTPGVAHAHVKWFTDASLHPMREDLVLSRVTAEFLALAFLVLVGMVVARRTIGHAEWPRLSIWSSLRPGSPTIFGACAGIGLMGSAMHTSLLAPNLVLSPGPLTGVLVLAQLFVAVTLATGYAPRVAGATLLTLVASVGLLFGPWAAAEQLQWVGIGIVWLTLGGRRAPRSAAHKRAEARALAALRIAVGAAIVTAAFTEKLWAPDLGLAFVVDHPAFNLLRVITGGGASDDLFVLIAGLSEGVVGVVLASGLLVRPVAVGAAVLFAVAIPFLPSQELLGHLPFLGALYMVVVRGPGGVCDWASAAAALRKLTRPTAPAMAPLRPLSLVDLRAPQIALGARD